MSSPAAYTAFTTALAEWDEATVLFENTFLEPPEPPFVYVEVFGDSYNQDTVGAPGANMWLEAGTTYIHVLVAAGSGSATARAMADSLFNVFREQDIGAGIHITEANIGAGEPGDLFPNYFAMTVSLFWRRYDITSTS